MFSGKTVGYFNGRYRLVSLKANVNSTSIFRSKLTWYQSSLYVKKLLWLLYQFVHQLNL